MTYLAFLSGLLLLVGGAEWLVRGASRLAQSIGISPVVVGLTVVAFGTSAPELAVSLKSAYAGQASIAVGNVVGSNIYNVLLILGLAASLSPLVVARRLIRLDVPIMVGVSALLYGLSFDGQLDLLDGVILTGALAAYLAFLVRHERSSGAAASPPEAPDESSAKSWGTHLLAILGGLALLIGGSTLLVESAVTIAQRMGVSELVVGLTVVAIGTSMPEIVTSVLATIRGQGDLAVGNVVGSNILNILAVLGVTSVLAPDGIVISEAVIGFDLPVLLAVAVACLPIFFSGGTISRFEGFLFLAYFVAYTLYVLMAATQHDALGRFSLAMLYFVLPITACTLAVWAWRENNERD